MITRLGAAGGIPTNSAHQSGGGGESADGSLGRTEEFVVPADENFTRCPVSKEAFETVWDDEEGAFMYRNAVKVLVTDAADKELFKMALPTEQTGMGYLIVHKPLVRMSSVFVVYLSRYADIP